MNINAFLKISGNGADILSKDGKYTFRQLSVIGLNEGISGNYWIEGRWVTVNMNAVEYNDGKKRIVRSDQKFVDITINNEPGRARVNYPGSWSPADHGKMTLYTIYDGENSDKSDVEHMRTGVLR